MAGSLEERLRGTVGAGGRRRDEGRAQRTRVMALQEQQTISTSTTVLKQRLVGHAVAPRGTCAPAAGGRGSTAPSACAAATSTATWSRSSCGQRRTRADNALKTVGGVREGDFFACSFDSA